MPPAFAGSLFVFFPVIYSKSVEGCLFVLAGICTFDRNRGNTATIFYNASKASSERLFPAYRSQTAFENQKTLLLY
ncbi:MAG: hypothetical protein C4522_10270 [Desulfobacteraceae bacterium]|nr:MAG: hypothetical protein C4522_10270 [Desulfobacteraceae bacterium]